MKWSFLREGRTESFPENVEGRQSILECPCVMNNHSCESINMDMQISLG